MNSPQKYTALKLTLPCVSELIAGRVSAILGREIRMRTQTEDYTYWSSAAIDDRFTIVEIMDLIKAVNGDSEMIRCCIPTESNTSRSIDMTLCSALLRQALQVDWQTEFMADDAIWIILDEEATV